jgi:hypothetical protein
MLKFPQKKTKWFGKAQSGFYIDFFLKKVCDAFIRNVFIFSSIFFGEKYMIEKLTRKIIESFLFRSNKFFGFTLLNFSLFIYITLTFLFYLIIFFNLVLIIIY